MKFITTELVTVSALALITDWLKKKSKKHLLSPVKENITDVHIDGYNL